MFRSINFDHKFFLPLLEQGESLLATCFFRIGTSLSEYVVSLCRGITFALIGVTDRRMVVLPLSNFTGRPVQKEIFTVPRTSVEIGKTWVAITLPEIRKTMRFCVPFGFNRFSSPEARMFREIINSIIAAGASNH